jgi:hypothetical protein
MGKVISVLNPELQAALAAMGIGDMQTVTRVVIDIDIAEMAREGTVKVYVEHYGSETVVDVVKAVSNVQIIQSGILTVSQEEGTNQ